MMTMMQRRGSSWLGLASAIALVLAPTPAFASKTGSWTVATPYTSTTSNGVTVTMSSTVDFTSVAGGTMMSTNFWNDPYAGVPSASIPGSSNINFIVQPVTTQTVTFTFSKAVNNPVLHIQRLGGSNSGLTNSSNWELTGSNLGAVPTLSRLSGNPQFTVTSNAFYRMPGINAGATGCSAASASATSDDATNGCGTVQVNGSGITSLTFTVKAVSASRGSGGDIDVAGCRVEGQTRRHRRTRSYAEHRVAGRGGRAVHRIAGKGIDHCGRAGEPVDAGRTVVGRDHRRQNIVCIGCGVVR